MYKQNRTKNNHESITQWFITKENMQEITSEKEFETAIQCYKIVIADFHADWCGPCKVMDPILQEIEKDWIDKVTFVKVNTDENIEIAREHQIMSIPTFILFKDGKKEHVLIGAVPKNKFKIEFEDFLG